MSPQAASPREGQGLVPLAHPGQGFAQGHMLLAARFQGLPEVGERLVDTQPQGPKAANRFGRMQLIVVAAHEFFEICKERFHRPAGGEGGDPLSRPSGS